MDRKELFITPGCLTSDKKDKPLPKAKIKDAWGNIAFIVKGKPPVWVKEVKVKEYKEHNLRNLTFSVLKERMMGREYISALPISKVYLTDEQVMCDLTVFKNKSKRIFVRRVFIDLLKELFGELDYYVSDEVHSIIAKKGNEEKAIVMPLIPKFLEGEGGTLVSPIEALRILTKRRMEHGNDSGNRQENE